MSISVCSKASPRGVPSGSRPSVSVVWDRATGIPASAAARTIPTPSFTVEIVKALTMSASIPTNQPICSAWNACASSAVIAVSG
nr:hypothetical protein [Martelella mediterranea]